MCILYLFMVLKNVCILVLGQDWTPKYDWLNHSFTLLKVCCLSVNSVSLEGLRIDVVLSCVVLKCFLSAAFPSKFPWVQIQPVTHSFWRLLLMQKKKKGIVVCFKCLLALWPASPQLGLRKSAAAFGGCSHFCYKNVFLKKRSLSTRRHGSNLDLIALLVCALHSHLFVFVFLPPSMQLWRAQQPFMNRGGVWSEQGWASAVFSCLSG